MKTTIRTASLLLVLLGASLAPRLAQAQEQAQCEEDATYDFREACYCGPWNTCIKQARSQRQANLADADMKFMGCLRGSVLYAMNQCASVPELSCYGGTPEAPYYCYAARHDCEDSIRNGEWTFNINNFSVSVKLREVGDGGKGLSLSLGFQYQKGTDDDCDDKRDDNIQEAYSSWGIDTMWCDRQADEDMKDCSSEN